MLPLLVRLQAVYTLKTGDYFYLANKNSFKAAPSVETVCSVTAEKWAEKIKPNDQSPTVQLFDYK